MSSKNRIATEVVGRAANKFSTTTFVLVGKGSSSFVKDGTGGDTGIPAQRLTHGKMLFLEMRSRRYLGAGNGYRKTQFVSGAPTIYVDDYYEDEKGNLVLTAETPESAKKAGYQFRPGLRSLGYNLDDEYRRSVDLGIGFEFGRLELSKYGEDPALLRFVMEHESNVEAPLASENKDPRRLRLFDFKPLRAEVEAQKSTAVENFDADFEAMEYAKSLRSQSNGGYSYDEAKMDAVLSILSEGVGLNAGDTLQKFKIIAEYAKRSGAAFISLVNKAFSEYRMQIALAEQFKVLVFAGSEAKLKKETAMVSICSFTSPESKEACIEELTIFFIGTANGQADYREMERQIDLAKRDKL